MGKYNLSVVYSKDKDKILFCKRVKDPYKGKYNFVGGKVEANESDEDAAYRELFEETGITHDDIKLCHLMHVQYFMSGVDIQVYVGKLNKDVQLIPEKNELVWLDRSENFCDNDRFAGECVIENILEQVDIYRDRLFGKEI